MTRFTPDDVVLIFSPLSYRILKDGYMIYLGGAAG
jgi:hypothetical protein